MKGEGVPVLREFQQRGDFSVMGKESGGEIHHVQFKLPTERAENVHGSRPAPHDGAGLEMNVPVVLNILHVTVDVNEKLVIAVGVQINVRDFLGVLGESVGEHHFAVDEIADAVWRQDGAAIFLRLPDHFIAEAFSDQILF